MDSVAQETTAPAKAGPTQQQIVDDIASDLFDRLSNRFTKIKSVTGKATEKTWEFTVKGPKVFKGDTLLGEVSCEAKFPAGVNKERIHLALYGFCEGQSTKLGVPMRRPGNEDA